MGPIHSRVTWNHQLEGEGPAVCRVRRGCSKADLEVKSRMRFSTHHRTEADMRQPKQPCMEGEGQEERKAICSAALQDPQLLWLVSQQTRDAGR